MIESSAGTTRRTYIIGRYALKFALNERGLRCNKFEFDLFQRSGIERRLMLCPSLWVSPSGSLLVQAAAVPLTAMMSMEEYLKMGSKWRHAPGDNEGGPFEPKACDWGMYEGRMVALDYANHDSLYEDRKPGGH